MKLRSIGLAASVLLLAGCSSPTPTASPSVTPSENPAASSKILLVSSTNVWGDIAQSIGGDYVEVTSIIDSFGQDPHSYEASARDQLAVSKADLVVANGGGYDDFMTQLAETSEREILYAVTGEEAKEKDEEHDHNHSNEHVWYDFHIVEDFAERLSQKLTLIDPSNAESYKKNLGLFLDQVEIVEDRAAVIAGKYSGNKVLSSEPVADYLLEEIELQNVTPSAFAQAIEEELDISPKVLLEVQKLLESKQVDLFVVNIQTGSSQVDGLIKVANESGISVVQLSELLPQGMSYFDWMSENLLLLESGLK